MSRRRGGEWTTGRLSGQRGLAMVAVLTVIFVLTVLSALVLYLSGKEIGLSAVRLLGAQSLNIAEGGAFSGRAALMALMCADPVGATSVAGTGFVWRRAASDPAARQARVGFRLVREKAAIR